MGKPKSDRATALEKRALAVASDIPANFLAVADFHLEIALELYARDRSDAYVTEHNDRRAKSLCRTTCDILDAHLIPDRFTNEFQNRNPHLKAALKA